MPILSKGKVTKRDEENKPIMFSGTHFDLTNIQQIEDKLEEQKQILHHQTKLASIGELAAGVGHEINNPLTICNGNVEKIQKEIISSGLSTPSITAAFSKYFAASQRIAHIVRGLRTFARHDSSEMAPFELNEMVQQTVAMVAGIYLRDNVQIEFLDPKEKLYVKGNLGRLQQALMNLIQNARDACLKRTNARVQIQLKAFESHCEILVIDNGSGIPENIRDKIFDNFFTTKEIGKGIGMGLSLTHSIVRDHLGTIELESQEGKGSTFRIVLPRTKPAGKPALAKNEAETIKTGLKALLVDDEQEVREIARFQLSHLGCQQVDEAENGLVALEKIKSCNYDLVITDMKMPRMDGFTLIKKIIELKQDKTPPIIVITGGVTLDYSKTERDELENSIDALLMKPFTQHELSKALVSCGLALGKLSKNA